MSLGGLLRVLLSGALGVLVAACGAVPAANLDPLHQATVLIEHAKGHGTGTIVGRNTVLTAYHVVQDSPLSVTFFAGPTVDGRVSWYDEKLDLALLEVAVPDGYPAIEIGCADLYTGQHLVAVGHPTQYRWVAVDGHLPTTSGLANGHLVPLGFEIGLGSSGGPVFDDHGRVVGVALAILAERSSASAVYDRYRDTGIGLMLPAKLFCDEVRIAG